MAYQQVQQGWGQMTAAVQQIIRQGIGGVVRSATGRRRKKVKASSAPRRKKRAKRASGRVSLKKGSAAAKAWGKKMARLRKRA